MCVCVCGTWGLEVERDHLAAGVPEDLRHVITGVHAASFGVDTAHLTLVVAALTLRNIFYFLFFSLNVRCREHVRCRLNVTVHLQDYF